MLYSARLRLSELLNMQIADVDIDRMQVFVLNGKGKKDRVSLLSVRLASVLESYYLQYKPKKMAVRSISQQAVFWNKFK
jgi:integrase/recombinase XerD